MAHSIAAATIPSLIAAHAASTPEAVFFIAPETGKTVSWRELAAALPAVAGTADSLQVPLGAPLAFMLGNGWAAAQVLLGTLCSGRVVLPLNLAAGDAQLAHALQQSGCTAIVVDEDNHARLRSIAAAGSRIAVIDRDNGIAPLPAAPAMPPPAIAASDRALLLYTSGTTGTPKGVLHTQKSLLASGANVAAAHQLSATDRALCVLPLYHINGLCVTVMAPLVSGGGVVMPHRFRTNEFWQHIAGQQCTWFSVVPTLISHLLQDDSPPPPPLPQLRFGRSASAPLPPSLHQQFEQRFAVPLIETMGLTETAAQILANPLPPAARKIGSPGIAVGNEVIVLNRDGTPAAAGDIGELAVRGDNVMCGYHDNPDETAATFTADGWLLTGDLGYCDDDGYFFVTGRRKELIIKGGENIAPREIDEALLMLPQVADAAAFACPCARYGERVAACVILKDGAGLSEAALIAHCRQLIGAFKSPDRIYFVAALPRGPSGKVQRLKLAELVAAGA